MFRAILDFLYSPVFAIGETPTSVAEILGFITGALCVYLVAKVNIWTFPVGIANAVFFFVLFIDAKLYADAWLQVFFAVIQVIGWWAWLKAGPNRTPLKVRRTGVGLGALAVGAVVLATIVLIPILREAHGSYPGPDATSTSLSVVAQILLSFKYLENWFLWIIADLIYIPLYFVKGLYFTSVLYIVFLSLCVLGLVTWRRVYREDQALA